MKKSIILCVVLLSLCTLSGAGQSKNDFQNISSTANECDDTLIDSLLEVYSHVVECRLDSIALNNSNTIEKSVSYDSDSNTYIPISVSIDKTKEVGEIQIKSDVSPTGAKTYEIPISVAAGMNGFQPKISLSYNSMQGDGVLGVGW